MGMANRMAVIDLGTNTFHLLIAEPASDTLFKEVLHIYEPTKLGEGGINAGIIRPDAYQRGLTALEKFKQEIDRHHVKQVKAMATSAMRCASNGQAFIDEVRQRTGIEITTINGSIEAGYIYQGVKASGCLREQNSLILDIGGGSIEFIIASHDSIYYKQSFEIGAARLMDLFHQTDPIPPDSIRQLYAYLDSQLVPVFDAAKQYPVNNLVGSSGAFETFAELIERAKGNVFDLKQHRVYQFDQESFLHMAQTLIQSSHEQRANMPGIIPVRVDMIVVAAVVTCYLLEKLAIKDVVMTAYSLKEGILAEMVKAI